MRPRKSFVHWKGPNGVECPRSIDAPVIVSTTVPAGVTCRDCLTVLPELPCERCEGAGSDPEHHAYDPSTGAPEPVSCTDCGGSGVDGPYRNY
jgi:hypothetical protein